ncbi:hypothetical protein Ahy_Scaffold6g107848 [Arachis hypogaea]|uniref:BRO1 domain-containing protein n=1 Tax=Arachis hypogaea TaxID=3818 RepID=A0A444WNR5_ARAHY|nr:uncharacterized protein LOC112794613 [Arachis hypogaea]RYQ79145.1 hypothetical protein Ahy_Scaffold6g107848 [Arachis hypogaea]
MDHENWASTKKSLTFSKSGLIDPSRQRSAIQLEKAAAVFNLGAIYSQIAASCDRTTALGRHLAMEAFKVAANFFLQLWQVFAKDVVATLDLTVVFAEFLHLLFSAQASELELREELNNNDASYALQQHRCALLFISVSKLYRRAYALIPTDSAARKHVHSFDRTWMMKYGKLVAYPWDMPPPYPTNSAILQSSLSSSSSDILAFLPLKKSESLNLYESLRSYFVLKYSESVAERVEGLLEMLHKLRN